LKIDGIKGKKLQALMPAREPAGPLRPSSPPVLSRAVRLAHSVRKQMVFAYPDEDVRYLEIKRLKP